MLHRGPTGRKLCFPKAGVPPGASRRDFPIHAGSLGPHRRTRNTAPAARVAPATSTTTATVEPTSTRGCAEATTPGVGDATTAGRIGVPHSNHPVRGLSAAPYDGRHSRPGSEPRLLSQSTRGRRDRNCGSRTRDEVGLLRAGLWPEADADDLGRAVGRLECERQNAEPLDQGERCLLYTSQSLADVHARDLHGGLSPGDAG